MRLTKQIRELICASVMKHRFDKESEALIVEEQALALRLP